MANPEAASEATLTPVMTQLNDAANEEVSAILSSLDSFNSTHDPAVYAEQVQTLVANGYLPEALTILDADGNGSIGTEDTAHNANIERPLMTWFGNGDDVIDFNDAGEVARIDEIIGSNGAFQVNGTPIQLTTPELASLIAIRQNAPALDSLGGGGFNNGDGKVGSADYNHAIGEGREAARDVTGRQAYIASFSDPATNERIFGSDAVSREQMQEAYDNPQNHPDMKEEEWRGLGYVLGNPDSNIESGSDLMMSGINPDYTKPFDHYDAMHLAETDNMDEYDMSAAREAQRILNENSDTFEEKWAEGRATEPETPIDVVPEESEVAEPEEPAVEEAPIEEVSVEEAPVEEALIEEAPPEEVLEEVPIDAVPIEAVPVDAVPIEEELIEEVPVDSVPVDQFPVEEEAISEEVVEEETQTPVTGGVATSPSDDDTSSEDLPANEAEQLESGAKVARNSEGQITSVTGGPTGYDGAYTYEGSPPTLKSATITDKVGDTYQYTKKDSYWQLNKTVSGEKRITSVDDVKMDPETGDLTIIKDNATLTYDVGESKGNATGDSLTTEKAVEALESKLGRDVTVYTDGSVRFTIEDGDTMFVLRNAVASSLQMSELSPGEAIYADELVGAMASESGIQNIDLINPGNTIVLSPEILEKYLAA